MITSFKITLIFILFVSQTFVFISRFKQRFEIALPICVMFDTLLLTFAGVFFHNLIIGLWLIIVFSAASLFVSLWCERKNLLDFFNQMFTAGFWAFCIMYVFVWITHINRVNLIYWDDYGHWGKFIKQLLLNNRLYTDNDIWFPRHKDYPPVVPLFEYIICKMMDGYKEGYVLSANSLLIICGVLPTTKWCDRKSVFKAILITFLCYMATTFTGMEGGGENAYNSIRSLLVDAHVGVFLFLYFFLIVFQKNCWIKPFFCAIAGIFLTYIKSSALPLALVGMGLYVLITAYDVWNSRKSLRGANRNFAFCVYWLILLFSPLVAYKLWDYHMRDLTDKFGAIITNLNDEDYDLITNLVRVITGNGSWGNFESLRNGIANWINMQHSVGFIHLNLISFMFLYGIVCAVAIYREVEPDVKSKLKIATIIIGFGYVVYGSAIVMSIAMGGADYFGGMTRYTLSYPVGMWIIMLALIFRQTSTKHMSEPVKRHKTIAVTTFACVLFTITGAWTTILGQDIGKSSYDTNVRNIEISERVDSYLANDNRIEREMNKVYITTNDIGYNFHYFSYFLLSPEISQMNNIFDRTDASGVQSTLIYDNPNVGYMTNPKEWGEILLSRGFTHVYLYELDDINYSGDFRTRFYKMFDCVLEEISTATLFEVIPTGNLELPVMLTPVPIEQFHYSPA
ncbi:MAG: hypothetical protein LBL96_07435 [Clostridiales bacterium]|jgi:hypothetical protein|nr:hypothetical protein [Clostridiales bacterium]